MRKRELLRPALLAMFGAASALSAAGLGFQYAEAGHAAVSPAASRLVFAADALGVALALLLAVQLLAAFRLFAAPVRAQFRMHRALALSALAFVALHGGAASWHALTPPTERLPLALVWIGLPGALGLAAQVATGFGGLRRPRPRRFHRAAVLIAILIVIVHVGLGTLHAVTG